MTTSNPAPIPTTALRGSVQKTFVPSIVLSGFTDAGHFSILAGEYLATLSDADRNSVLAEADRTRAHVATLAPLSAGNAILGDITHTHVNAIRADPLFAQSFGPIPHLRVVPLCDWSSPGAPLPSEQDEEFIKKP
jgi:hypothetical protein